MNIVAIPDQTVRITLSPEEWNDIFFTKFKLHPIFKMVGSGSRTFESVVPLTQFTYNSFKKILSKPKYNFDISNMKFDDIKIEKNNLLKDFQLISREFLIRNKRAGLILDTGLGKTITSLSAVVKYPVLIVCSKTLVGNWKDEIKKHFPQLTSVEVKLLEDLDISNNNSNKRYIITYDKLKNLVANNKSFGTGLGTLILDESIKFKNYRAGFYKSVSTFISKNRIEYVYLLTAAPVKTSTFDYYWILNAIMPSKTIASLSDVYDYFCDYSTEVKEDGTEYYVVHGYLDGTVEGKELIEYLNMFCICYDYDNPLVEKSGFFRPKLIEVKDTIRLSPDENRTYKEILKKLILAYNTKENELVNLVLLRNYVDSTKSKLDILCENVASDWDDEYKIIISAYSIESIGLISERLKDYSVLVINGETKQQDRDDIIKRFCNNIGEHGTEQRHILLLSDVGNLGLNLQQNAEVSMFIYTKKWTYNDYYQFISRAWRNGQIKPVKVHNITTKFTVDEAIENIMFKSKSLHDLVKTSQSDLTTKLKTEYKDPKPSQIIEECMKLDKHQIQYE